MRKNRKSKSIFHASIKTNRSDDGTTSKIIICTIGALAGLAALIGLFMAFKAMKATWLKQSIITDASAQVTIHSAPHIPKEAIQLAFGLKEGENLAEKDFDHLRSETMAKYPVIRNIIVERHLPDKVEIFVEEREPVARLEIKGERVSTGLVVDSEGVVFDRRKGVELLPSILEKKGSTTTKGQKLNGTARAALELVLFGREEDFENIRINTIDATKNDYLVGAMSNSQLVKIAWEGMLEKPTNESRKILKTQLLQLRSAVESKVVTRQGLTWNVLEQGIVTIDTKEPQ